MAYRHNQNYQNRSFSAEQEAALRASAGPSVNIDEFLTPAEFDRCRRLFTDRIQWPEVGVVSKYLGFGFDDPRGQMLKWLARKIDDVLPDWELDFFAIQEGITPWRLHADIRWEADRVPYKVILLPMDVEPESGAVGVDEWPDTATITFNQRNYLSRWPDNATVGFLNNNDQSVWPRPVDQPMYEGLVPGYHITEAQWHKYFSHMPYDHLEGMTIDHVHTWRPRSMFYWDNSAVHCADNFLGAGIRTKRCLMIFTVLKQ
jgi:hypothetical protein